jgi:long-chain fatty acid transport protein
MVEVRGGVGVNFFAATSQDFSANPAAGVGAFVSTPGVKTADAGHAIGINLSAKIKF